MAAEQQQLLEENFRLKQEAFHLQARFTRIVGGVHSAELLELIDEKESEIQELEKKIKAATAALEKRDSLLFSMNAEWDKSKRAVNDKESFIVLLTSERARDAETARRAAEAASSLEAELSAQISQLQTELQNSKELLKTSKHVEAELIRQGQELRSSAEKEIEAWQMRLIKSQTSCSEAERRAVSATTVADELRKCSEAADARAAEAESRRLASAARSKQLRAESEAALTVATARVTALETAVSVSTTELASARVEREAARREGERRRAEAAAASAEAGSLRARLGAAEDLAASLQAQLSATLVEREHAEEMAAAQTATVEQLRGRTRDLQTQLIVADARAASALAAAKVESDGRAAAVAEAYTAEIKELQASIGAWKNRAESERARADAGAAAASRHLQEVRETLRTAQESKDMAMEETMAYRLSLQLRWTEAERRARAAEARRDASLGAAAVARSEAARDWAGARAMLEAEAAEGRAASVEARALRAELARARADLKVKDDKIARQSAYVSRLQLEEERRRRLPGSLTYSVNSGKGHSASGSTKLALSARPLNADSDFQSSPESAIQTISVPSSDSALSPFSSLSALSSVRVNFGNVAGSAKSAGVAHNAAASDASVSSLLPAQFRSDLELAHAAAAEILVPAAPAGKANVFCPEDLTSSGPASSVVCSPQPCVEMLASGHQKQHGTVMQSLSASVSAVLGSGRYANENCASAGNHAHAAVSISNVCSRSDSGKCTSRTSAQSEVTLDPHASRSNSSHTHISAKSLNAFQKLSQDSDKHNQVQAETDFSSGSSRSRPSGVSAAAIIGPRSRSSSASRSQYQTNSRGANNFR